MSDWKNTEIPQAKKNARVAIVAAKFNEELVNTLLENTKKGLLECDVEEKNIDVFRVPGAFELPFTCKKLIKVSEKSFPSASFPLDGNQSKQGKMKNDSGQSQNDDFSEKKYDAIIALGIVIRGETVHFELVANEAARGIMKLNTKGKIPVIFGVLACENEEQVQKRLELGHDFAVSAVEMMSI